MASLMEDLIEVLEKENSEYEKLLALSMKKTPVIIGADCMAPTNSKVPIQPFIYVMSSLSYPSSSCGFNPKYDFTPPSILIIITSFSIIMYHLVFAQLSHYVLYHIHNG